MMRSAWDSSLCAVFQMGLEDDRLWLRWISASEGQLFADTITEMTAAIKKMGPNPMK